MNLPLRQSMACTAPRSSCECIGALVALFITLLAGTAYADRVFDARGFAQRRDHFNQYPYEHIDPMTGNLVLTFTDLALPGNAGFDLRIQRSYNSKIYPNYDSLGETLDEDSWAGIGWTLHFGRVLNPDATAAPFPAIEMSDGSRHQTYRHIDGTGRFVTRNHWIYDRSTSPPTLLLPNGMVYRFGHTANIGAGDARYATEITDPFGNRVTIAYMSGGGAPADGIDRVTQHVGADTREVTFTHDVGRLASMTFLGRTWLYGQTGTHTPVHSLLLRAEPPVGPAWQYEYNTTTVPRYELTRLSVPFGFGDIAYQYADQTFRLGTPFPVVSRVVTQRTTTGSVTAGTWTYAYAQGPNQNQSIVNEPCRRVTYTFMGIGNYSSQGAVWKIGLLERKQISDGVTEFESQELTWRASDPISNDSETVGHNFDPAIYVPLLATRTVIRGGNFVTTLTYSDTNYNDYGRPYLTTETGEGTRTTTRTFQYGFTPYIVDKVAAETVTVSGQSFTRSSTYDLATGFMTSQTTYGIPMTYVPWADGNLRTERDANNNATHYEYRWGLVSRIDTPEYAITRVINPEGTVASETRRGFTTSFAYDNLFRLTGITPAVGNATTIQYDNARGEFVHERRGLSRRSSYVDGFARVVWEDDSVGIQRNIGFDACGRKTYEGYPFLLPLSNNIGTLIEYDPLDRVKTQTHPDARWIGYGYIGNDVTIRDEEGRTSLQQWSAFGDPNGGRLVAVTDANNQTTSYAYNAVDKLTDVTVPGVPTRQWRYNTRNLLETETHPESGTVSYVYDPAGRLDRKTDARGQLFVYGYDGNDRLRSIDGPGTAYDITMTYDDSDNRRTLVNSFVSSALGYDPANRMDSRTDIIGGRTFATTYVYTGNDALQEILYHSGRRVVYGYDSEDRLTSVTDGASYTYADTLVYHPSGAPLSFRAGNGLTHTTGFDNRYRPRDINAGGQLTLTYGYDGVSNVLSITDARPGMNQSFQYDPLDRMQVANGFWGNGGFSYSASGNRLSKQMPNLTNYTYNPTTNRLAFSSGWELESFNYDPNGNTLSDGSGMYTYTPTNMLETATVRGTTTTYRYDGDDVRKLKIGGGVTSYYLHGAGSQLLSELQEPCTGTVVPVRDYVYANGRLLASIRPNATVITAAFSSSASSVGEDVGTAAVTVTLVTSDGLPVPCPVTVQYATTNGTAEAATDYATTSGVLTFPGGSPSGSTQVVNIPITSDTFDEPNEVFTLSLLTAGGAVVGTPAVHTVTILDDDPTPTLTINDVSVIEGHTGTVNAVFTVTLSAASGQTVTVNYETANGTATAPADYTATSGQVTFLSGLTTQPITVVVNGERLGELHETFFVNLSGAVNATIADGQGVGTILDDDRVPIDPTLPSMYFADLTGGPTYQDYIIVMNPHDVNVTARLTFTRPDGSGRSDQFVVAARSRTTVALDSYPDIGGQGDVSGVVQSTDLSRPLYAEHAVYWGTGWQGGRGTEGVAQPATAWHFAEGTTGLALGFDEYLTVFNPGNTSTTVTFEFYSGGNTTTQAYAIAAGPGRLKIRVSDIIGTGISHGTRITATQPVTVERTMLWSSGQEGHSSPGAASTATLWYLAEGHKGFFDTFVILANPNAGASQVVVNFLHENGSVYTSGEFLVGGRDRWFVQAPVGMPNGSFGIEVVVLNGVPVVAERAMYLGTPWTVGTIGVGSPATATRWFLPEGASGTFFDTYLAVVNPTASPATIYLRFFLPTGGPVDHGPFTVPARSRWGVKVDDLSGVSATAFATEVTSTVGVVVERVLYWEDGAWRGGHVAMGHR